MQITLVLKRVTNPDRERYESMSSMAIDSKGNLYFSNSTASAIMMMSRCGVIRPVPGSETLPSDVIRGICIDQDDVIYAALSRPCARGFIKMLRDGAATTIYESDDYAMGRLWVNPYDRLLYVIISEWMHRIVVGAVATIETFGFNVSSKNKIKQICFDDIDPNTVYVLMDNGEHKNYKIRKISNGRTIKTVVNGRNIMSMTCHAGKLYYATRYSVLCVGSKLPLIDKWFSPIATIAARDNVLYIANCYERTIYRISLLGKWDPCVHWQVSVPLGAQIKTLFAMASRRGTVWNRLPTDVVKVVCGILYDLEPPRCGF